MPIRFRCAYCDQLMGIARRKAGSVVQCPRCSGQVIVPDPEPQRVRKKEAKEVSPAPKQPLNAGEVFERSDLDKLLQQQSAHQGSHQTIPSDASGPVAPAAAPRPGALVPAPAGIVLTPGRMTLLAVGMVILLGAAFFLGVLVGGQ